MNVFVYTIAVGPNYEAMAELLITSLRRFGQFDGEVHVIRDISGAIVDYPASAKSFIGQTMDLSSFDYVLYLDADVLVTAPIAPLFNCDRLRAFHEYDDLSIEQWPYFATGLYESGRPGINAGIIVAPAAIWNQTCALWWERLRESKLRDQVVLNELIVEGAISFEPLPGPWATSTHPSAINRPFSSSTIFLHCHCCVDRLVTMTRFWECISHYGNANC